MTNPYKILFTIALVVLFGLTLGLFLPGFIHFHGEAFCEHEIVLRLPNHAKDLLTEFEASETRRNQKLKYIDSLFFSGLNPKSDSHDAAFLLEIRAELQNELDVAEPPIKTTGYYFSSLMILWPTIYTCLGLLLFVIPPPGQQFKLQNVNVKRTGLMILIFFPLYRWPTWFRNLWFGGEEAGRTVYHYANFDIAAYGFFLQEFMTLIVCLLLVLIWQQWVNFYLERRDELSLSVSRNIANALDKGSSEKLSRTYVHWQIASLLLAIGFLIYTRFFWDQIVGNGDQRYLLHAIIVHSIWALTWLIISLPLIITWQTWLITRNKAFAELGKNSELYDEIVMQALLAIKPIGFWNAATSGIVAMFSFALPLLEQFFK